MRPPLNFTGHGAMRTGQCKAGGGGQGPAKAGRPQGSGAQAWRRNTGKQHSQASYGSARCGDAVMQQILPTPFLGGPGFILGLPRYAPKSTIVFFHKMATMEAANPALRPLIPACPTPHCSQDQTHPPPSPPHTSSRRSTCPACWRSWAFPSSGMPACPGRKHWRPLARPCGGPRWPSTRTR